MVQSRRQSAKERASKTRLASHPSRDTPCSSQEIAGTFVSSCFERPPAVLSKAAGQVNMGWLPS